jgi:WhiB family redox-sensing transcriptional regulator
MQVGRLGEVSGGVPPFRFDPDLPCRANPAEWWFPTSKPGPCNRAAIRLCREVCPRCRECLVWAMDTRQAFGIYGGTTLTERRRLLRDWRGRRS